MGKNFQGLWQRLLGARAKCLLTLRGTVCVGDRAGLMVGRALWGLLIPPEPGKLLGLRVKSCPQTVPCSRGRKTVLLAGISVFLMNYCAHLSERPTLLGWAGVGPRVLQSNRTTGHSRQSERSVLGHLGSWRCLLAATRRL